eukprot:TRINITY_DN8858_c0_g2_i2.p1 TRINITY_DN8858_c0_g2~~TRINITY_DN8858_c0_g2_i2.p1  ORF type:complete len:1516 (+),score=383.82 TRINITY_DN8858_c0_g2_i2:1229-5776(+)
MTCENTVPVYPPTDFRKSVNSSSVPKEGLALEFAYGLRASATAQPMQRLSSGEVVYAVGSLAAVYHPATHAQRVFTEHTDAILCIAVHPNGRYVATGQDGKTPIICVWDAITMKAIVTIVCAKRSGAIMHANGIVSLDFNMNGKRLVSVSNDKNHTLIVWEWEQMRIVACEQGHSEKVNAVKCSPFDPDLFVTCGVRHYKMWNWNNGLTVRRAILGGRAEMQTMHCIAFTPDGRVMTGSANGFVYVWKGHELQDVCRTHKGAVNALACAGDAVATGGADGHINIWHMKDFHCVRKIPLVESALDEAMLPQVSALLWMPPRKLNIDDVDWSDTDSQSTEYATIASGENTWTLAALCTNGQLLVTGPRDTDSVKILLQGHSQDVAAVTAHPTLPLFATVGFDQTARVWNARTRKPQSIFCFPDKTTAIAFSQKGDELAVGTISGELVVITLATEECKLRQQLRASPITVLKFSLDCRWLAIAYADGNVDIFDVTENYQFSRSLSFKAKSAIYHLDWSVDSLTMQANTKTELLMWNAFTCEPVTTVSQRDNEWASWTVPLSWASLGVWPDHEDDILAVARSSSERLLVAGDGKGRTRLFRFPSFIEGSKARNYPGHLGCPTDLCFTAYDEYVISVGAMGCVLQYKVGDAQQVQDSNRRASAIGLDSHARLYHPEKASPRAIEPALQLSPLIAQKSAVIAAKRFAEAPELTYGEKLYYESVERRKSTASELETKKREIDERVHKDDIINTTFRPHINAAPTKAGPFHERLYTKKEQQPAAQSLSAAATNDSEETQSPRRASSAVQKRTPSAPRVTTLTPRGQTSAVTAPTTPSGTRASAVVLKVPALDTAAVRRSASAGKSPRGPSPRVARTAPSPRTPNAVTESASLQAPVAEVTRQPSPRGPRDVRTMVSSLEEKIKKLQQQHSSDRKLLEQARKQRLQGKPVTADTPHLLRTQKSEPVLQQQSTLQAKSTSASPRSPVSPSAGQVRPRRRSLQDIDAVMTQAHATLASMEPTAVPKHPRQIPTMVTRAATSSPPAVTVSEDSPLMSPRGHRSLSMQPLAPDTPPIAARAADEPDDDLQLSSGESSPEASPRSYHVAAPHVHAGGLLGDPAQLSSPAVTTASGGDDSPTTRSAALFSPGSVERSPLSVDVHPATPDVEPVHEPTLPEVPFSITEAQRIISPRGSQHFVPPRLQQPTLSASPRRESVPLATRAALHKHRLSVPGVQQPLQKSVKTPGVSFAFDASEQATLTATEPPQQPRSRAATHAGALSNSLPLLGPYLDTACVVNVEIIEGANLPQAGVFECTVSLQGATFTAPLQPSEQLKSGHHVTWKRETQFSLAPPLRAENAEMRVSLTSSAEQLVGEGTLPLLSLLCATEESSATAWVHLSSNARIRIKVSVAKPHPADLRVFVYSGTNLPAKTICYAMHAGNVAQCDSDFVSGTDAQALGQQKFVKELCLKSLAPIGHLRLDVHGSSGLIGSYEIAIDSLKANEIKDVFAQLAGGSNATLHFDVTYSPW